MKSPHLTVEEVAERWQMSPATLRDWRWKGTGPRFIRMGQRTLYPLIEVEAFERKRLRRSTVDEPQHAT